MPIRNNKSFCHHLIVNNVHFFLNVRYVFINHCIRIVRIRNTRFFATTLKQLKKPKHVALIVSYKVWKNTYIFVAIMSFSSNWHTLKVTISGFTVIEI